MKIIHVVCLLVIQIKGALFSQDQLNVMDDIARTKKRLEEAKKRIWLNTSSLSYTLADRLHEHAKIAAEASFVLTRALLDSFKTAELAWLFPETIAMAKPAFESSRNAHEVATEADRLFRKKYAAWSDRVEELPLSSLEEITKSLKEKVMGPLEDAVTKAAAMNTWGAWWCGPSLLFWSEIKNVNGMKQHAPKYFWNEADKNFRLFEAKYKRAVEKVKPVMEVKELEKQLAKHEESLRGLESSRRRRMSTAQRLLAAEASFDRPSF